MKPALFLIVLAFLVSACNVKQPKPISLHPDNPHYFLYHEKPLFLIGSTEHYGALMNLDFDYNVYLEELSQNGLNLTRCFTGIYREHNKSFNIRKNTLAPDSGKYICPWRRSSKPGYVLGGNKFDLRKWDAHYFKRLKDFVTEAGNLGIIVEIDLFSNFYDKSQWLLSPLYEGNNVNHIGKTLNVQEVLSLKNSELVSVQEKYVRKMVSELRCFDNVYYEICNEPYFGDLKALKEWQKYMTEIVIDEEKSYKYQHLISHNVGNGSEKVESPMPGVSILNFHYATPPTAVDLNFGLKMVIGDNETGFAGIEDKSYRTEAWDFLLAGGGLFNHLDYSFTTDFENGAWPIPQGQPGGGGKNLRLQFKILKDFLSGFDFIHMAPQNQIVKKSNLKDGSVRVFGELGKNYAIFVNSNCFKKKENFSLRWKSKLKAPVSGKYILHTISDDGVKLWLDNKLLISNWKIHSSVEDTVSVVLKEGQSYDLKIEYFQHSNGAVMDFLWTLPGKKRDYVTSENFFLPDTAAQGLKLEYFGGVAFDTLKRTGYVDKVGVSGDPSRLFNDVKKLQSYLMLDLPAGKYSVEWMDTKSGEIAKKETLNHSSGDAAINSPLFSDDIAVKIIKIP